jgi:MFS family permease
VRVADRRRFVGATVIDSVGSGLWMPFALLFFVRAQGIGLVDAGAALSVGGLVGLGFVPLVGGFIDRFGVIPLMVGCNVARFAGFLCYPLTTRPWQVSVIAAVIALGDRVFWTANTPMANALSAGREAENIFGTQTIARFVGAGIGAGGTAALPTLSSRILYHLLAFGNAVSFAVAAVLILGLRKVPGIPGARVTALAARETAVDGPRRSPASQGSWRQLLRHRQYVALCATHVLFALASVSKYAILSIVVINVLHGPQWLPGAAVVIGTVVILLGQRPVTRYFSRRRRVTGLRVAALIFATSFAALSLLTVIPLDAAIGVILLYSTAVSFAEAIFAPVATFAAAAAAPPSVEGRASALFQLSWGVAQVAAPFLLTALLSVNNEVLWLTLAGLLAFAGVAVQLLRRLLDSPPVPEH